MAASQKLTEHFLTCPVCLEVFTDPCTLTCGHSFCSKCVVSYTKTRPDAVSAQSLPCPFCKRLLKVPNPDRPVEEWVGQFKPSLLLLGLMDTIGPGSKDTTNCHLCHEGGELTPATVWCSVCDISLCESCLKVHDRMPATRNHNTSERSGGVKVKQKRRVMCHEHKDECKKYYCKDCKETLCQSCSVVYHRKCESVKTLESMLPEMRSALCERKAILGHKIRYEEKELSAQKTQHEDIQKGKSSIQSQIRSTAQKAMDAIKKKEKQLMDELDEITDKQMGQLKADIKSGDMAIQIYKQQSEMIDLALNSDSEIDMYDLHQSCESWVVETSCDTGVKKRTKTKTKFSQDVDKINKALDELSLGEIQGVHESMFSTGETLVHSNTINCSTKSDKESPFLYDVVCIKVHGNDTIIVTDYMNKCVKSFYIRQSHSLQGRLELKSGPCRLAKLEENRVAISLPDSRQIATLTVTPDLSLLSYITTTKQYSGLTVLTPTTLAVGSSSPPCVDILDRSGNVLQSISSLHNGQKIIKKPNFLCTTKEGNILVSDEGTKSVLCLTPQGEEMFNYSPTGDREIKRPAGITVTDTGDILVVDYRGYKVIQLSESGQFVRDILTHRDGLRYSYGLHYDGSESVYVTHTDKEDEVRVFTFNKD